MNLQTCRWCDHPVLRRFVDLGRQPLANRLPPTSADALAAPTHPLRASVCESCLLVQLDEIVDPEDLFGEYAYFSSYSSTWVEHARSFVRWAVDEVPLARGSLVVEVASNDGYLLRPFAEAGMRVVGVEPAQNVAAQARATGIDTISEFFGRDLARQLRARHGAPQLVVANNVWAHVPDLRDFTAGLAELAGDDGLVSIEVPHVLALMRDTAFDTIYHEHHSYFSLLSAQRVLGDAGLDVVDVHRLPTHGGSLRILARAGGATASEAGVARANDLLAEEAAAGLHDIDGYASFAGEVARRVAEIRSFLDLQQRDGRTVAGYGAAAKATVTLNAAAATAAQVVAIADRSPHKVGRYVPGCGTPIVAPEALVALEPDVVVVFVWNLIDEVAAWLRDHLPATAVVALSPEISQLPSESSA